MSLNNNVGALKCMILKAKNKKSGSYVQFV
jgi:hypothetical protein